AGGGDGGGGVSGSGIMVANFDAGLAGDAVQAGERGGQVKDADDAARVVSGDGHRSRVPVCGAGGKGTRWLRAWFTVVGFADRGERAVAPRAGAAAGCGVINQRPA